MATIGILAATSLPSLMSHVYRAKRSEAFLMLKSIYRAQLAQLAESGYYANSFDELGVEIGGRSRLKAHQIDLSRRVSRGGAAARASPGESLPATASPRRDRGAHRNDAPRAGGDRETRALRAPNARALHSLP